MKAVYEPSLPADDVIDLILKPLKTIFSNADLLRNNASSECGFEENRY